jgi:hypothetical protein
VILHLCSTEFAVYSYTAQDDREFSGALLYVMLLHPTLTLFLAQQHVLLVLTLLATAALQCTNLYVLP